MPATIDPDLGVDVAVDAVERAARVGADAARVNHEYSEVYEVNFDTSDITLVRTTVNDTLGITVFDGTRKGSTQLSGRAHDMVDAAVVQALEAAKAGEPDAANVLPSEAVERAEDRGDEEPDRESMIDAVLAHLEVMRQEYPQLKSDNSTYSFSSTWSSHANSHGRVQHARRGRYMVTVMVSGKDDTQATSFNYAVQVAGQPFGELTSLPALRRLFDMTVASFDARPVPRTFTGDVIFTPESLDTLVEPLAAALHGLSLMRRTSPFLDRQGERIAAPGFSLLHRPDEVAYSSPFDNEGFVNHDLDVIVDGVLENFLIDWYFSKKLGRPMTVAAGNFVIAPGTATMDELIAGTERGILLGRFSGGTPNQKLDFSGVAKNSFYVEDGRVRHPIAETMIAGNFGSVLSSIKAISSERLDIGTATYPWLAASGITISTK